MRFFVSRARQLARRHGSWRVLACAVSGGGRRGGVRERAGFAVRRRETSGLAARPMAARPGHFVTSGDDGSTPSVLATGLQFDPPQATVTLDGTNPQTVTFQLQASVAGGPMQSVTPSSIQFDRPDLASATIGSPVSLTASRRVRRVGEASRHLRRSRGDRDAERRRRAAKPGHRSSGRGRRARQRGRDAHGPAVTSILYPYDKTVFPLGPHGAARDVDRAGGRRARQRRVSPAAPGERVLVRRLLDDADSRDQPRAVGRAVGHRPVDLGPRDRLERRPRRSLAGRPVALRRHHDDGRGVGLDRLDHRAREPCAAPSTTGRRRSRR